MVRQGFSLGDRDWYIMAYYDIRNRENLNEVRTALLSAGCSEARVAEAVWVLSMWNKGFTFSNLNDHLTVMCMSKATEPEQMYDSIQHETKHAVEHISEYYGINPRSEDAAYLQGEIGRNMFKAAAIVVCPKCHGE